MYLKAKTHVENVAMMRSFKLLVSEVLRIINRHLGSPTFLERFLEPLFTITGSEKHLEPFMIPRKNGCFIDVGANIGSWTFFLAKKGVRVHAFEPSPKPFPILNRKSRNYRGITLYRYALGDKNSVVTLNIHHFSGHNSIINKEKDYVGLQIKIPVKPLDSFNIHNVGLIKIDTQGYEVPILLGAQKTILLSQPRLIIEVHEPIEEQKAKILTILRSLNYKWIVRPKSPFNPPPHIIADPIIK